MINMPALAGFIAAIGTFGVLAALTFVFHAVVLRYCPSVEDTGWAVTPTE